MNYHWLPMTSDGCSISTFALGNDTTPYVVTITTRYNYVTECWFIDMADSSGNPLLTGIALLPNINLMSRFPDVQANIGSLSVIEINAGDYTNPDLLGTNVQLLWYPVGTEVVLPI